METEIQEMLPDLLHGTLAADARARVETHVASCEQCREELAVLRTVKSAAVLAPAINVDQVVRRIPPYQKIVPAVERPAATTRVVSWLVAATMAIALIGGGSLVLARRDVPTAVSITDPQVSIPSPAAPEPTSVAGSGSQPEPATVVAVTPHTHALALAADVGGLSDGNLEQLMTEMAQFDALPATEGDPVISVDTSYDLDQDSE
jgi:anti-sigma factor RsiW